MLIFLVGLLLGVLIGGALCVHHLRHEMAANVGPQLRQLSLKIETLESVLNLALISRHGEQYSLTPTSTSNEPANYRYPAQPEGNPPANEGNPGAY